MSVEENLMEKFQRESKEQLQKLKEKQEDCENNNYL
jgi:hypothetical protein